MMDTYHQESITIQKWLKENKRPVIFTLVILLCSAIGWIVYAQFGHQYIESIYEGGSTGFLGGVIEDPGMYSLEEYYKHADVRVRAVLAFAAALTLVGFFMRILGMRKVIKFASILIILSTALLLFYTLFISIIQFFIIVLPIISSYFLASILFKKANFIDKLNIVFLVLCCQIIFITEVLSLFKGINAINYLIATTVLFSISLLLCRNKKNYIHFDFEQIKSLKNRLYQYLQDNKLLAFFFFVILLSFLWRIFLIFYVPPNSVDSMTRHLSKIAYWIQNQSLHHFFTYNLPQISFPFNAQIMSLWTMVASKLDFLCGFIQFACYLLSGTLVYRCVRQFLKADVIPSMFVMFVWYSLPQVVLQSTSTKNDLVVAYFVMFCLVYFLLAISRNTKYLTLSAVALGVAVGTKVSSLVFVLPFALLILFFLIKGIIRIKWMISWSATFVVSWVIFSSYSFVQNYVTFQNVFGPAETLATRKISSPSIQAFFSNFSQSLFNLAANLSGLHLFIWKLSDYYNGLMAIIGEFVFQLFHIPKNVPGASWGFAFNSWGAKFSLNSESAYFGAAGMVMILLIAYLSFMGAVKLIKQNIKLNPRYLIFAFLFIGCLLTLSYLIQWTPFGDNRYMIILILTGIPMLALIFSSQRKILKKISSFIILYSIVLLIPSTFHNGHKSLIVLHKDRVGLRCVTWPTMEPIIRKFNSVVPLDSKVGTVLSEGAWDYPLFGQKLKRRIVQLNMEAVETQKFDFILIGDNTILEQNKELKDFITQNYKKIGNLSEKRFMDWILYVPKL